MKVRIIADAFSPHGSRRILADDGRELEHAGPVFVILPPDGPPVIGLADVEVSRLDVAGNTEQFVTGPDGKAYRLVPIDLPPLPQPPPAAAPAAQ
jgi:hypothetical protein